MARIPDSEVQRLKDEVSVERLVEAAGIELKRVGKDLAGRCPFHEDAEPSLVVTPAKNLWHCFGCQIGGGPIDWVMKLKGVSFRHAVELLKDESSLAAATSAGHGEPVKRTSVRTLPAPVALDADDRALLAQVMDYYHATLTRADCSARRPRTMQPLNPTPIAPQRRFWRPWRTMTRATTRERARDTLLVRQRPRTARSARFAREL